jgi:hypothetical protein
MSRQERAQAAAKRIVLHAIEQACRDQAIEAYVSKASADRRSKVHKLALRVILLEDALEAIDEKDLL